MEELKIHILDRNFQTIETYTIANKKYGGIEDEEAELFAELEEKEVKMVSSKDISITSVDTIADFKNKIAYISGIMPYEQHLYIKSNGTIPMRYSIRSTYNHEINIEKINDYGEVILNVPIDIDMYNNNELLYVEAYDSFTFVNDIIKTFHTNIFYLIPLSQWLNPQHKTLTQLINDKTRKNMLYYGFILKYYPILTYNVYEEFLNNNIKSSYPQFHQVLDWKKENELFDTINSMKSEKFQRRILSTELRTSSNSNIKIYELFKMLQTNNNLLVIELSHVINNELHKITKLNRRNVLSRMIYNKYKRILKKTYGFIRFLLLYDSQEYVISLRRDGTYSIFSNWANQSDANKIFKILSDDINPFIKTINDFSRRIFTTSDRINYISKNNSRFANLNIILIWKKRLNREQFNIIQKSFDNEQKLGVVSIDSSAVLRDNSFIMFIRRWFKYDYELLLKIISESSDNEYAYYSDPKIMERWNDVYLKEKQIEINSKYSEVQIIFTKFSEGEYKFFSWYFAKKFASFAQYLNKVKAKKADTNFYTAQSKNLINIDPELYNLKQHGSKYQYSRKCQKKRQPVIYSIHEWENKDKVGHLYKNFTTGEDVYYHCPNKNFPYFSFLTSNIHPKDYCIPCCFAKKPDKSTKIGKLYTQCMETKTHRKSEIDISSRYIFSFGKIIPEGRLSHLPSYLENFVNNLIITTENIRIFEVGKELTYYKGKAYKVKKLWSAVRKNKVIQIPIKEIINHLEKNVWSYQIEGRMDFKPIDVIENPMINKYHYNRILMADLSYPIIVIKNEGIDILDGLHRLAKAYLEKKDSLPATFITESQLQYAEITGGDEKDINELRYCLVGVKQQTVNYDIGLISCLSTALGKNQKELIDMCISYIKENENIFNEILDGKLNFYYNDISELINDLRNLLTDDIKFTLFNDWNDLIKDIFGAFTGIFIIEFEICENNIYVHIDQNKLLNIDNYDRFLFVVCYINEASYEIKFEKKYIYNPIFKIIPRDYYQDKTIDESIFSRDDPFTAKILKLIQQNIDISYSQLNYNFYNRFCIDNDLTIDTLYKSKKGYIYNISINGIIVPVVYSRLQSYEGYKVLDSLPKYNQSIKEVDKLIEDINNYSRKMGVLRMITIEKYILNNKGQMIGYFCDSLKFRFNPTKAKEGEYIYEQVDDNALAKAAHTWDYTSSWDEKKIAKSFYKIYGYNLFLQNIIEYLDDEKNKPLRNRLDKVINNYKAGDEYTFTVEENLSKNDKQRLHEIFESYNVYHYDKNLLRQDIDTIHFDFDKITLSKLNSSNIKKVLEPVFKNTIEIAKPRFDSIKDIYCPDAGYCKGKKIVMTKKTFENYCKLLHDDLENPIRRNLIKEAQHRFIPHELFDIKKNIYDEIYYE